MLCRRVVAARRTVTSLLVAGAVTAPAASGQGSNLDTATFRSQALGTAKRYVVYLPPSYARDVTRRFPVAYYLHGLDGDETNWTTRGRLQQTLDSLIATGVPELIVVMPDGDDSWYTTWNFLGDYPGCLKEPPPRRTHETVTEYCVPWPHYDDYVARDLVAHIDSTYRTQADRRRRGIAGLSMGGYGALSLALTYPNVFAAAASHSGVVAPMLVAYDTVTKQARYAGELLELKSQYPAAWPSLQLAFGRDTAGWWARDPGRRAVMQVRKAADPLPAIYIDVGLEDRFLNQARALRDVLQSMQLRPMYFERVGAHDWPYWTRNAAHSVTFLAEHLTRP